MDILKVDNFSNIYMVDCFDKEFKGLFGKNKKDCKDYSEKLVRRLEILDNVDADAVVDGVYFEKLKQEENLYSIRFTGGSHNPRVLYCYEANPGIYILLAAFTEKNKNDYRRNIKTAKNRLSEL